MQKFQAAFMYNKEILVSNVFSGFHCFCDVKDKNGLKKKKKKNYQPWKKSVAEICQGITEAYDNDAVSART